MLMVKWMLLSFFLQTQRNWQVFIHDDGTLEQKHICQLRDMGFACKLITKSEADDNAMRVLADFEYCQSHREQFFMARKFYDPFIFSPTEKYLILDSDLIFFKRPDEILEWAGHESPELWFNEDVSEHSQLSPDQTRRLYQFELWPRVNAGLGCISKVAIDFSDTERFLKTNGLLKHGDAWMLEQTLYALHASKFGKGGLLPATYEVSLGRSVKPKTKCRHYVGAIRDQFFSEGVKEIRRQLT